MGVIHGIAALAGRVLISILFLIMAANKITDWERTSHYMAANGIPYTPFFLTGAVVLLLLGGISIIIGYRARLGALALLIFLVPTTFIFHDFWTIPKIEPAYNIQMDMFFKNLSIMGGLLFIFSQGSGPLSLSSSRKKYG